MSMDVQGPGNGPMPGLSPSEAAENANRERHVTDSAVGQQLMASSAVRQEADPHGGKVVRLEPALREAVDQVNAALTHQTRFRFEMVRDLDTPVLRVIDARTNEVIRQIPSEESLQRMRALQKQLQARDSAYQQPGTQTTDTLTGVLVRETR